MADVSLVVKDRYAGETKNQVRHGNYNSNIINISYLITAFQEKACIPTKTNTSSTMDNGAMDRNMVNYS